MTEQEQRYAAECYACPIGTISMKLQEQAPDATEHLVRAGRELLAVAVSLIQGLDAFLTTLEERATPRPEPVVRSIPVRRVEES